MEHSVWYKLSDGTHCVLGENDYLPEDSHIVAVFERFLRDNDVIVYAVRGSFDYGHMVVGKTTIPADTCPIALIRGNWIIGCLSGRDFFVRRYALANNLIVAEETY